jgi:hypothetical protein
MVQLFATMHSCIAILWVSLTRFAAITLCVASRRLSIVVNVYFIYRLSPETFGYILVHLKFHRSESKSKYFDNVNVDLSYRLLSDVGALLLADRHSNGCDDGTGWLLNAPEYAQTVSVSHVTQMLYIAEVSSGFDIQNLVNHVLFLKSFRLNISANFYSRQTQVAHV